MILGRLQLLTVHGVCACRQEGSAAEAIKKELVRALTDSEFAAASGRRTLTRIQSQCTASSSGCRH